MSKFNRSQYFIWFLSSNEQFNYSKSQTSSQILKLIFLNESMSYFCMFDKKFELLFIVKYLLIQTHYIRPLMSIHVNVRFINFDHRDNF